MSTHRDGPNSARDPLDPVPAARQRAALALLTERLLDVDTWALPGALQRKLSPDYLARAIGRDLTPPDLPLAQLRLDLQRDLLNQLMSDRLSERLLDNAARAQDRERQPLLPMELQRRLVTAIWAPHRSSPNASAWRDLQREHINRLAQAVVRNGSTRADVRATFREQARALLTQLKQTQASAGSDVMTRAHLQDCIDTLQTALMAQVGRPSP